MSSKTTPFDESKAVICALCWIDANGEVMQVKIKRNGNANEHDVARAAYLYGLKTGRGLLVRATTRKEQS